VLVGHVLYRSRDLASYEYIEYMNT